MAHYYVAYSKSIGHKYKANVKSNVTVFLVLNALFCFLLPFIFSYNSHGFWIKENSFREQPLIRFKYQYLIILESRISDIPFSIVCTTYQRFQLKNSISDKCSLFKILEKDENGDGKNDRMKISFHVTNASMHEITDVYLFLAFDYKLHSECILTMEVMTAASYIFPQAIGKLEIISELKTEFKKPIYCTSRHIKSNNTIVSSFSSQLDKINTIHDLLSHYSLNSVNVNFKNLYYTKRYKTETAENEPLIVIADIHYSEQEIIYKTRFWQLLKWAWIQYFSILALFIFLSRKIKQFVFHNRILQTIKTNPSD